MDQHRPRSILKHTASASIPIPKSSRPSSVRFPSTPKLSTVHYTHCPIAYDRSPIVVLPNTCAIPERNCRLYSSSSPPQNLNWGKEAHPSIILTPSPSGHPSSNSEHNENGLIPPPLMHDEGSSEESDGLASPPPELAISLPSARRDIPSQSHLHSPPFSHPPLRTNALLSASSSLNAGSSDYPLAFTPRSHLKKRERPSTCTFSVGSPTFSSTWQHTDETSCLGGF